MTSGISPALLKTLIYLLLLNAPPHLKNMVFVMDTTDDEDKANFEQKFLKSFEFQLAEKELETAK